MVRKLFFISFRFYFLLEKKEEEEEEKIDRTFYFVTCWTCLYVFMTHESVGEEEKANSAGLWKKCVCD